jgi:peptide/nickel transport system substrate-binding protein
MPGTTRLLSAPIPRIFGAIAALAALLSIAGCGSSSSSTVSATAASDTTCKVPNSACGTGVTEVALSPAAKGPVNQVVWDEPYGEPASLNPLMTSDLPSQTVLSNICDGLTRLDPNLHIVPGLASAFSHPTPTTWVYTIRPGVKFWDGHPLTPADVVYSLQQQINPKNAGYYLADVADVKSVAQTGPNQVTLTTTKPDYMINDFMSEGLGTIVEKAYAEKAGSSYGTAKGGVMCTGPFEFKSWTPGQQIVLTRNPHYWDPALEPKVGTLIFKFVTDPAALTSALESGEVDGTYETPIQGIQQLQSAGKVYYGKNFIITTMFPINSSGPAKNPTIRNALAYAINRQAIAKSIFNGLATPLKWAFSPDSFGYDQNYWINAYNSYNLPSTPNLALARQLVKQAGSPKQTLTIAAPAADATMVNLATVLQATGQSIGLNMRVKLLQPAQYVSALIDPKARKGLDFYIGDNAYTDTPEPIEQTYYAGTTTGPFNSSGYSNPQVDKWIAEARGISNPSERAKVGLKAVLQVEKDKFNIPITMGPERMFMNKRITGAPPVFPVFLEYPWAALLGAS